MRHVARLCCAVLVLACGGSKQKGVDAGVVLPEVTVSPSPGAFTDTTTLTFTSDVPATIFVSLDGSNPQTTSAGRLEGESPFTVMLKKTTTVKYFASAKGKDGALEEGTWVRVGGVPGTISGVVVVGWFAAHKKVAISRGTGALVDLGLLEAPGEIPFKFEGLGSGTYRVTAYSDRDDDGQVVPFIDFNSDTVTVTLDSADLAKASAESVRVYLGASSTGLGTLRGTVTLPNPPALQNLQISVLSPDSLTAGFDPMVLLQQLQGGYRIFTSTTDTEYPYVMTDLKPGAVLAVPSLIGFGNGGLAINFIANPLKLAVIEADQETIQDHAFGPVNISGEVTVSAASAPSTPVSFAIVAARAASTSNGIQAVLMPILLVKNAEGEAKGGYAGSAIRANQTIALRVFTDPATAVASALTWVVNPFAPEKPHATLPTRSVDATLDIEVP